MKMYPLTSQQAEIWLFQQMHPEVPLYNIGGYLVIGGPIDVTLLQKAINGLIEMHDSLRIVLLEETDENGVALQTFLEPCNIEVPFIDFSEAENSHETANMWMQEALRRPFSLTGQPLFRFTVIKTSDDCYYLLQVYHHLVSDGRSITIYNKSLAEIYNQLAADRAPDLQSPLFAEYIENDRRYRNSKRFADDRAYWLSQYPGPVDPLFVPRSNSTDGFVSDRRQFALDPDLDQALRRLAQDCQATFFHALVGALYVYCTRVGQRDDFAIGLPVLNRATESFKRTGGLFVNVNPTLLRFGSSITYAQLLGEIKSKLRANYRHQRFPIGDLVRELGITSSNARLFDICLSYEREEFFDVGAPVSAVPLLHGCEPTPVMLFIREYEGHSTVFDYSFNLAYQNETDIEVMHARLIRILEFVVAVPEAPLAAIPVLTEPEADRLRSLSGTETATAEDGSLAAGLTAVRLFEARAAATPEAEALVHGAERVSYGALNARANRLAHRLIGLGIAPERLVAVCLERSVAMVVAVLAVMKAGAAYVPVAADLPAERRAFILEDCRVAALLTDSPELAAEVACPVIVLDPEEEESGTWPETDPAPRGGPDDLAYLIFTSGSTGRPKGVMIEQGSLVNMIGFMRRAYAIGPADRTVQMASIGFDVSVAEIFPILCAGGALVVVDRDDVLDPGRLSALLARERITFFGTTPLMLSQLALDRAALPALRLVFSGGEALSAAHYAGVPEDLALVNGYGPTEATVGATVYRIARTAAEAERIPIGRPVDNLRVYVLDAALRPLPAGVAGELCIAGAGVARGYWNRPELTAEKFVEAEVLGRRERLYRTGDKALWRADGNLEFLGRLDRQVKLRGFRIELGEVEAALAALPGVRESAVVAVGEGASRRLIGYVAGPDAGGPDGDRTGSRRAEGGAEGAAARLHGAGGAGRPRRPAAHRQRQGRRKGPSRTRIRRGGRWLHSPAQSEGIGAGADLGGHPGCVADRCRQRFLPFGRTLAPGHPLGQPDRAAVRA